MFGVSLTSSHLGKTWRYMLICRTQLGVKGQDLGEEETGKEKKKPCCKRCSKKHRDEVGPVGEGLTEPFIRFYLSLNRDNQLCCLFPYQILGGQNSVTFLTQIILAAIFLE